MCVAGISSHRSGLCMPCSHGSSGPRGVGSDRTARVRSVMSPHIASAQSTPEQRAYVVGTFDTKRAELRYLAECIVGTGVGVATVDVGLRSDGAGADVSPAAVAAYHPLGVAAVLEVGRSDAIARMAESLTIYLRSRTDLSAVVGAAGSSGAAIISPAMRALAVGIPRAARVTRRGRGCGTLRRDERPCNALFSH